MTELAKRYRAPNLKFAHIGLVTRDVQRMRKFYTEVLGFVETDGGNFAGMDVVFLSRDLEEHHQIVLTPGRPEVLPKNTVNPNSAAASSRFHSRWAACQTCVICEAACATAAQPA